MEKVFFIGIKGAGMSALAQILHDFGNIVKGSDIEAHVFTEDVLREKEIEILPFQAENLLESFDLIIRGNAFNKENNVEVAYLEEHNIPYVSYYEYLQLFLSKFTSFAVTGTHGKTTTTGLLTSLFANDSHAYLIGDGTGYGEENAEYFIFEACEYKRHFLSYYPDYTIITNIEFDHPDYFHDLADVIDSFIDMAKQTKKKVIAFGDDLAVQEVIQANKPEKFITFGFDNENDYVVKNYFPSAEGMKFELWYNQELKHEFSLPFFGKHMLLDSIAAMLAAHAVGKEWEEIEANIYRYGGVKRRFNIEEYSGYTIIDDYAHHPTEIAVTLEAAKQKFVDKKIIAIFQPHTFTRTTALATEFIEVLKQADTVYLTDIFASAREQGTATKPDILLDSIPQSHFLQQANIEQILQHKDDVLIFMGAGNIQLYLEAFKKKIEK